MYPEIKKVGGLASAINLEFEKLHSDLKVVVNKGYDQLPLNYAIVENGNKFSQIYLAAKEKLYLPDFWRDGVCLAHGRIDKISDLARAVDYWLTQNVTTQELAKQFSFVRPNEKAKAFDENKEVDFMWKSLVSEDDSLGLKEIIELASKDECLSKLFPFTSLYTLCFSKCTGFPFDTTDLPNVTPIEYIHFVLPMNTSEYAKVRGASSALDSKLYVVTKNKRQYVGEGNAFETLNIILDILPKDLKPARKGTADD